MGESMAPDNAWAAETGACFAVILQGAPAWAGVVMGIEGVQEILNRLLLGNLRQMPLKPLVDAVASMDDPSAWAVHGTGDGRPFWHWWLGYEGGSATVQRLTAPLPQGRAVDALRATLGEVTGTLTECARDLRALGKAGQPDYVFARRHAGQASAQAIFAASTT